MLTEPIVLADMEYPTTVSPPDEDDSEEEEEVNLCRLFVLEHLWS